MDECHCRNESTVKRYPVAKNAEFPFERLQVLDFGCVKYGKTYTKIFEIFNASTEAVNYVIKRDPSINPMYKAFEYGIKNKWTNPKATLKIKITYTPKIPNEASIDYLQIFEKNSTHSVILQLKGESKAFNLQLSATRLYFHVAPNSRKLSHVIEMENRSEMETHYQLECHHNMHFTIEKKPIGTIAPDGFEFIAFKLKSSLPPGIYYDCVYCLSSYYEPLLIELIGIVSENPNFSYDDYNLQAFPLKLTEHKNFSGYMYDSIKLPNVRPPFDVNRMFYDFGSASGGCETFKSNSFTAAISNNLSTDIQVTWLCEVDDFGISPQCAKVRSSNHVLFEVTFKPKEPDCFYVTQLRAIVEWQDCREQNIESHLVNINLPLSVHLTLLGNTFPENKTWIPQIDVVPSVITLPITTPNSTTYTTFLLVNKGYLPTSFKFVPPSKTNFILKPMLGIVREFQIIVAQLNTTNNDKSQYVECWTMECNGSRLHGLPFYLKGSSEQPTVVVGNANEIVFGTIQYSCEEIVTVQMKNTSGHLIEYNFAVNEHDYVRIDRPQGTIAAKDIFKLEFCFQASSRSPSQSKLRCSLRPIFQMKSIMGQPTNMFVNVFADVAYSELCAIPKRWICDSLLYKSTHVIKFLLYNFGESPIYFALIASNVCIDLMPKQGTLFKNNSTEIILHITGHVLGMQEHDVRYRLRKNEHSPQMVDEKEYDIFKIKFNCVVPQIQIEDIVLHDFGRLFTKVALWKLLNVDEINRTLKSLEPHTTRSMQIHLPDSELSNDTFSIALLLVNASDFSTTVKIKRKRLCDCRMIETTEGMSLRSKVYDCPHRQLVNLNLSNNTLETKAAEDLTITLNYKHEGEHTLCHVIHFSHERILEIYEIFTVIGCPTNVISVYDTNFTLHFDKRFIGRKEPSYKAFYLYNNTKSKLKYDVNLRNIEILNARNNFDVIECANETGELEAYDATCVLFKFVPLEPRVYEINVPLILGEKMTNLFMYCEGIETSAEKEPLHEISTVPNQITFNENAFVHLSEENVDVEVMLTHSTVRKLIFIKNLSKDYAVGYSFKTCQIDDFILVKAHSSKGTLKPKEIKTIIIVIRSFDKSCQLRIQMICKLLNHNKYIERKKSEAEYYMRQYELAGQFTITENGIEYPVNDVQLAPKPKFFYKGFTLNVTVINDYDKDSLMDTNAIFRQTPQDTLRLNSNYISKLDEIPCYKFQIPNRILQSDSSSTECFKISQREKTVDYFSMLRDVIDYCLSDVLHCKVFDNMVDAVKAAPTPYYYQMKTNGDGFNRKLVHQRLCKKYATRVPSNVLLNVLRQLITDSIYELFSLGPQENENDNPPTKVYDATVSKCIHVDKS